jgi:hypothetical protein
MRLTFARRHRTWRERHHGERQGIARRRHADTGRRTRAEEITRGIKAYRGGEQLPSGEAVAGRSHTFAMLRPRGGHTRCTAVWSMHEQTSLCRAPTLLDVMDHVLDNGVIVEAPTRAATEATSTSSHIALLDVTVRVNVTTDAEGALKETTR